ncbi:hypothetical protein V2J09_016111 [Rumex salicifolius]
MMRFEEDTDREVDLNAKPDLHVNCSICLELVDSDGPRSTAKLQCGHEFHLECIGSAFNAKGIMQCPNCRNIEKGQWLYAIGSANVASDISMDAWIADQYPFFLVPYGFRICPIRGLMEMEDPSIGGDAFYGNQDSSSPGLAYFTFSRPNPHAPLNPSEHIDAPNEIHGSPAFPSIDMYYPPWRHHLTPSPPRMIERRSSNGFPATYLPGGRPYDPRAWLYYPPAYVSTVPNYLQPAWGRGVNFPGLPSEPWLRHR